MRKVKLKEERAKGSPAINEPKDGSLTTEFTEIKDIMRVHRVFLSHLFGYYSVSCFLFNDHGVFSALSLRRRSTCLKQEQYPL